MSEFENDLQRLTFLKRTIALLSSMVDGGECHTTRSKEMKNNAQQVILGMEANVVKTSDSNCNIPLVINWVALSEKLPDTEWGDLLVCLENEAIFIANYSRIGNERWLIVGVGEIKEDNPVKYWAKLPEPPCL